MTMSPPSPHKRQLAETEIIICLLNKVSKRRVLLPFEINRYLPTLYIYSKQELHEIFNRYPNDEEIYFLTEVRRNLGMIRHKRPRWRNFLGVVTVCSGSQDIGIRRSFVYSGDSHGNKYFLREYTLADKFKVCVRDDCKGFVFCTVVKRDASCPNRFNSLRTLSDHTYADQYLNQLVQVNTTEEAPVTAENDGLDLDIDLEYLWNFVPDLVELFGPIEI